MKAKSRVLTALCILAVLACALTPQPAAPASARQAGGRGLSITAEDGKEVRLYERSYALVVGVSDYTGGWPALPGVKKDIEEVARALERHGFLVTKVENPDAAQLDKAFKTFIDAYGLHVENRLLFYFAGHGHTIRQSYGEEMGYIVPADAPSPLRDRPGFMSKAMDMQQMELYARRIQSKHALFLFDSCFSGALFALSRAIPASIGYKTARPVRQFITSGSADEQVPDQSIFRRQFVEALDGEADVNKDGYVTGTELGEFLQDKVINYSRNAQHPQYGKIRNPNLDKGDFVFALPKSTPPTAAANNSPTPAGVDPSAVELAFWDAIKNSTDPEEYQAYLTKYPDGQFAAIAKRRAASASVKPAPAQSPTPSPPINFTGNSMQDWKAIRYSTDPEVFRAYLQKYPAMQSPPAENIQARAEAAPGAPGFMSMRIRVRADEMYNGWTHAALAVRRGQRLRVSASGTISLGQSRFATPMGLPRVSDSKKLMRDHPTGGLVGVIGDDNDEFIYIGMMREFIVERDGDLFFGINEGNLSDNTGTFEVTIEFQVMK